jgi:hypothetical protein
LRRPGDKTDTDDNDDDEDDDDEDGGVLMPIPSIIPQ